MFTLEFDDLIYSLQKSGGASVYWKELSSRIVAMRECTVVRNSYSKYSRGIPVISKADVFHSSHFRFSCLSKTKNVTTAHDLTYEKGLIPSSVGSKVNILERKLSYFTADAIICISENTKHDLLQIYPALQGRCGIYVIPHGLSDQLPYVASKDVAKGSVPPYLLFVGGRGGYKNFSGALEGYFSSGLWREGVRLVCTGSKFGESELQTFRSMGLENLILCEEHVNTMRMQELYQGAYCLLYTSFYEGFGLPPIEAMRAGCPVVASNVSSIPEVVGDAGILIDPGNHDDISKAILQLQGDETRADFIKRGLERVRLFSWDKSAEGHFKVYENVQSDNHNTDVGGS